MNKFLTYALGAFLVGCLFLFISNVSMVKDTGVESAVPSPWPTAHNRKATPTPSKSPDTVMLTINSTAAPSTGAAEEATTQGNTQFNGFSTHNGIAEVPVVLADGNAQVIEEVSYDNGMTWQEYHEGMNSEYDYARYCQTNKHPRECLYIIDKFIK